MIADCAVGVHCYGVSHNPLGDRYYHRYGNDILNWVIAQYAPATRVDLKLVGGMTNHLLPQRSEAACLKEAIEALLPARREQMKGIIVRVCTVVDEQTGEPRDLIAAQQMLAMEPRLDALFCNWSRQDRVRWLAKRLLPGVPIVTSNFDERSMLDRLREQRGNVIIRLAYHSAWFREQVQMPMRRRFMKADALRRAE